MIAAPAEPRQRIQGKKEKPCAIENVKAVCSFSWVSAGFSRHAGSCIRINRPAQSRGAESFDGLEGTWRAELTIIDCQPPHAVLRSFPAKFSFARGGTVTVTTAGQPPSANTAGLGVWNYMYGRTYSAVTEAFVFGPDGVWTSTQRLTRLITVSRDAKTYADSVALQILDIHDNVIVTGCGTSAATRME